jgi:hypothetical protein
MLKKNQIILWILKKEKFVEEDQKAIFENA